MRPSLISPERPWIWLLPLSGLLAAFYLYPMLDVVRLSFTDATLFEPRYRYTLAAYLNLLADPDFKTVLVATVVFVVGSACGQIGAGLLIALALQAGAARRLPGVRIVQIAIIATWVIPGVSSGIIWRFLFSETRAGFFNGVLVALHIPPVAWLSDPNVAIWSTTLANIWRGTALSMILLQVGLQSIPETHYETAALDGAGALQCFRYVTLPLLRPFLSLDITLVGILSLNSFDMVMTLTGGGPGRSTEVLPLAAYNAVFRDFDLAQGCMLGVLMLLLGLGIAMFCARMLRP